MQFTNDNRGVSEVIGAILVFGLLIALLAIIQTQAVPAANQQVEFDHNQEVQGDLAKFHERASRVSLTGSGESVSIKAGTGYPSRMLFFNPPRATGTISTTEPQNATLKNVEAVDPEVFDYLNGTDDVNVTSRAFEYSVNYNEFQEAPETRYEYGILYDEHRDTTIVKNTGSVIDDTDINLVFMTGDYSRSSGTAQSLDIRPVSAPSRPVTVTGKDDDNLTLVLPTEMSVEKWNELYGDQDTVLGISEGPRNGTVKIDLNGEKRYTMRMAGLGLEQGVEKPDAHYIVPADPGVTDVDSGGRTSVIFEVRDKYNNPVAGEEVEIEIGGEQKTVNTSTEGRAAMSVSPSTSGMANATIVNDCTSEARCKAQFDVNVIAPGGVINPSGGVRLQETTLNTSFWGDLANFLDPDDDTGHGMTFNFSAPSELNFEAVRVNYYSTGSKSSPPDRWEMTDGSESITGEVSGGFNTGGPLNPQNDIHAGFTTGGDSFDVEVDDYVVITVILSNGDQAIYFASPSND
ncbi:hypothetical protein HWV07_00110 [Natronomonas salina]|uniref:hypothetical protein n=1 Tax=Natronomonas salina TaxID=1710540 RepID=UPI0015B3D564|nr:hypothetical protein [Natronomonas salina]QLD87522.1 hypothetical protein HWV07_00110 [Natronomonas salina]